MANIVRPPIVFTAPNRPPIGQPDPPQRPLTIIPQPAGITLPYQAGRIDYSAPPRKYQPQVDVYPNLSATTLKPAAGSFVLPLSAERTDWSPPIRKYNLNADTLYYPLTLGINPNAGVIDWSESAPRATKSQIIAEQYVNPVLLHPVPKALRTSDSAPSIKHRPRIDEYPNLSITTLAASPTYSLPLSAIRIDSSAPMAKFAVFAEQYTNPVVLLPIPGFQQLNNSAPWVKYQPQVDVYPNLTALGINPNAVPMGWTASAPPPKTPVYIDTYPNLSISTLASFVTVPNVVGETQAQATTDITGVGLVVSVSTDYSDTVPIGSVISQIPVGGSSVLSGSMVSIIVSLGAAPVPAPTGSVPGFVRGGKRKKAGPVMRDGQVFGEAFPISPFMETTKEAMRVGEAKRSKYAKTSKAAPIVDNSEQDAVVLLLKHLL